MLESCEALIKEDYPDLVEGLSDPLFSPCLHFVDKHFPDYRKYFLNFFNTVKLHQGKWRADCNIGALFKEDHALHLFKNDPVLLTFLLTHLQHITSRLTLWGSIADALGSHDRGGFHYLSAFKKDPEIFKRLVVLLIKENDPITIKDLFRVPGLFELFQDDLKWFRGLLIKYEDGLPLLICAAWAKIWCTAKKIPKREHHAEIETILAECEKIYEASKKIWLNAYSHGFSNCRYEVATNFSRRIVIVSLKRLGKVIDLDAKINNRIILGICPGGLVKIKKDISKFDFVS